MQTIFFHAVIVLLQKVEDLVLHCFIRMISLQLVVGTSIVFQYGDYRVMVMACFFKYLMNLTNIRQQLDSKANFDAYSAFCTEAE